MPEQLADYRYAFAERQRAARVRVAAVVDPHLVETSPPPDPLPDHVQVLETITRILTRDDPRVTLDPRYPLKYPFHRRRQRHPTRTCFRIPQLNVTRRTVDVVPPQREDLVPAAAGQQNETNCRYRRGKHRSVGLGLVEHPRQPHGTRPEQETARADTPCICESTRPDCAGAASCPRPRPA